MRKIQILGTGCPKCKALTANAEKAVKELGIEAKVEKIDKIQEILKFNIMTTPAIAIDGEIKATGKVLSVEEITKLLS